MRKILILPVLVFTSFFAMCQVQRKPASTNETHALLPGGEKDTTNGSGKKTNIRQLLKELNLTTDQKTKLKEILQTNKAKRDDLLSDATLSESQKQDKLKENRQTMLYNLQAILSGEQKAKLAELRRTKKSQEE